MIICREVCIHNENIVSTFTCLGFRKQTWSMGGSACSTTVKCIDGSSKKPWLILSLCLVKQLLQYLHLNSPWLSFKRKIKHFVQVFLRWFSFLTWWYRDSFILSRHSYWQTFPTRISRLIGWHPCDCVPFYPSVLKPTSIHRPPIHGLSRWKERADKSQNKQYILKGNKVLSFSWEIYDDDYCNWYQKMLSSMVPTKS